MKEDALDNQLMERIVIGDQRAFSALVRRYLPKAHAIAQRMLPTHQDAEEAVSDTFGKIWVHAINFDTQKASFGTWFTRILANTCIDLSRRRPPAAQDIDALQDMLADVRPLADQMLSEKHASVRVRQAVQALPEKQRLAVVLCYFEEMTNPRAAEVMGLHIKALEGLLVRARKTLRKTLKVKGEHYGSGITETIATMDGGSAG